MWPKFLDICLTVEGKSQKNLNQEIDPTGDWTETQTHSGYNDQYENSWSYKTTALEFSRKEKYEPKKY